jgi:hypothetical protein
MKQQKAHRAKIGAVKKGDQVVTSGGIVGKVTKVDDEYIEADIAQGVKVKDRQEHDRRCRHPGRHARQRLIPTCSIFRSGRGTSSGRSPLAVFWPRSRRWPRSAMSAGLRRCPARTVNLGLDLAGGSHILLEANQTQVAASGWRTWKRPFAARCDNARPAHPHRRCLDRQWRLSAVLHARRPRAGRCRARAIEPLMQGTGLVREWTCRWSTKTAWC